MQEQEQNERKKNKNLEEVPLPPHFFLRRDIDKRCPLLSAQTFLKFDAKQFGQAFLKLDAWCESTRGLNNTFFLFQRKINPYRVFGVVGQSPTLC